MPRYRRDIGDDIDDFFGAEEAARIRAEREENRKEIERRNAEAAEHEAIYQAAREKRRNELTAEGTRRHLWREYDAANVEPPIVDGEGNPTCSLSLLLSLGWTIMPMTFDRPKLLKPVREMIGQQHTEGS